MAEYAKILEITQGRNIKDNAAKIWGWAGYVGALRVKRRIEEILKKIDNTNGKRILELGSGIGIFTEQFIKRKTNVVGFDISHDLIRLAKEKRGIHKVLVTDAESMPFQDESFDCVVGISVLHHFNLQKALLESRRVLKKRGKVIFSEPNMLNPQVFLQKKIKWIKKILQDTPNETAFFRWRLKSDLENFGFTKIKILPFEFLHPSTPKGLVFWITKLQSSLERLPLIKEIGGSLLIYAEKV